MTLGEKIKEARKEHGLSQEQFAEKLCVSRSAVAKWEHMNCGEVIARERKKSAKERK